MTLKSLPAVVDNDSRQRHIAVCCLECLHHAHIYVTPCIHVCIRLRTHARSRCAQTSSLTQNPHAPPPPQAQPCDSALSWVKRPFDPELTSSCLPAHLPPPPICTQRFQTTHERNAKTCTQRKTVLGHTLTHTHTYIHTRWLFLSYWYSGA